jgi:hypothetical protein
MQLPEFYFNGEAIYRTRPWLRYKDTAADGREVHYTSKGAVRYAIVIKLPADKILTLPADLAGSATLLETGGQGWQVRHAPFFPRQLHRRCPGRGAGLRCDAGRSASAGSRVADFLTPGMESHMRQIRRETGTQ